MATRIHYSIIILWQLTWGPLPGGIGGPWTPQNKTGGSSNRFGPPRFLKNIKILCEVKDLIIVLKITV